MAFIIVSDIYFTDSIDTFFVDTDVKFVTAFKHFLITNTRNEEDNMIKNTADQHVAFQMVSIADGSAIVTGTPVVYVTGDGGTQGVGAGAKVHEGNGCWSYVASATDSNFDHVVFTMVLTGAVSQSINTYTVPAAFILQYDGTGVTGDTYPATQAQVGNISSGTAATNTVAASSTITTGTPTLTYAVTHALDGVTHDIAPSGGTTDFYYTFNVGVNGSPVAILWEGFANSNGDSYAVFAYNFVSDDWNDQIGAITAINGSTVIAELFNLTTAHVETTGANKGDVSLKFYSTDGTNISTDRILCSFATVYQSVGYESGAIWIDTEDGFPGVIPFINGVADNPVDTIVDAANLSNTTGLKRFHMASASAVTLSFDVTNFVAIGDNWSMALAGQIITDATAIGATVTGNADITSTNTSWFNCHFGTAVGLTPSVAKCCGFTDTITLLAVGTYVFKDCFSEVAGTATPVLDFGATIGTSYVNFRNYSGGIEVKNMKPGDTMSYEGNGQLIVNANCTGGNISVAGNFVVTDTEGVITFFDGARFDITQINDVILGNADINSILADTGELQTNQGNWDTATGFATPTNITAGTITTVTNLTNAATSGDLTTTMKASVNTEVDSGLTDYDGPTKTEMDAVHATTDALINGLNDISVANIMDSVIADLADEDLDLGASITVKKILRGLFNRFYREVTINNTTLLEVVKGDSAQTISEMVITDDGTQQTKGAAS